MCVDLRAALLLEDPRELRFKAAIGLPFRRADAEKTLRAVAADGNAQAKAILHVELLFRVVAKEGGEELRSDPGERSRTTAEPDPCCHSSYATAEKHRHLAGAAIHHQIGREHV